MLGTVKSNAQVNTGYVYASPSANDVLIDKPFECVYKPVYKCKGFYTIYFEVRYRQGLPCYGSNDDRMESYIASGDKPIKEALADIDALKKLWFKPL
jgi:hypothetical protein